MSITFSPDLTLVPYSPDRVELRRGVWNAESITLEDSEGSGTLWPTIDLLRQGLDPLEVPARVAGLSRQGVEDILDQLRTVGALVDGVEPAWSDPRPVWILSDQVTLAKEIAETLQEEGIRTVVLADSSQPKASTFLELTLQGTVDELRMEERAEAICEAAGASDPLLVVALAQNHPAFLRAVDQLANRAKLAWLHAAVDGPALYVGPYVVPGQTSSYRTFETRVAMNLRERQSYLEFMRATATSEASMGSPLLPASVLSMLSAHAAHEAATLARHGLSTTRNKVLSIYLPTMEIAFSDVLPMSQYDAPSQAEASRDLYYDMREWLVAGEAR